MNARVKDREARIVPYPLRDDSSSTFPLLALARVMHE